MSQKRRDDRKAVRRRRETRRPGRKYQIRNLLVIQQKERVTRRIRDPCLT